MERKKIFGFFNTVESRLGFLLLGMIACVFILLISLLNTQLIKGDYYRSVMENQSLRAQHLPSARGLIRDRNGVILADNRATFYVELYLKEIIRSFPKGVKVPYKENRNGYQIEDIGQIVHTRIPRLSEKLDLPEDVLTIRAIERHYDQQPFQPYRVRYELDQARVAQFYENSPIISGADITVIANRYYPFGPVAAHILGYVGKFEQPPERGMGTAFNFFPEFIGKQGIEKYMEDYLTGEEGGRMVRVNTRGFIEEEVSVQPPVAGDDIYLTIDVRLQQIVEKALESVGRGAAVIVDVNTGEVLALASSPGFDPNSFVPAISGAEWARLNQDPKAPLFDRAVSAYPPGSIFKPVIALAALESGKATGNTVIYNGPGKQIGNHYFKCWSFDRGGLGNLDMRRAIAMSGNVYFYELGLRTGPDAIYETGVKLGFGEPTGLEIANEASGIMPGPAWLKRVYPKDRWGAGYTANTSIGQGFVMVTPLQMTMATAAIANGGTLYKPLFLSKVVDSTGKIVEQKYPQIKNQTGFKMENLKVVREGMLQVVENGTGGRAKVPGILIAGKTGTAQAWQRLPSGGSVKDNKAWFISFAPFEKTKYAMALMVEGGVSGGSSAAPLVGQIYRQIFSLPEVPPGEVPTPLTEDFFNNFATQAIPMASPEQEGSPDQADADGAAGLPIETTPEQVDQTRQNDQRRATDPSHRIRGARGLRL